MVRCQDHCCHFCKRRNAKTSEACPYPNIQGGSGCPLYPDECQSRVDAFLHPACKLFILDQDAVDKRLVQDAHHHIANAAAHGGDGRSLP